MRIHSPHGLLGRSVLIVVVPILLLQVVVAYVFLQRHYDRVTRQLTSVFVAELKIATNAVSAAESAAAGSERLAELSEVFGLELELRPGARVVAGLSKDVFDITGGVAADQLNQEFGDPVHVRFPTEEPVAEIMLATRHGALFVRVPRTRLVSSNPYLVLTWSAGAGVLLVVIALLFLHNQVQPIRRLAKAAEAFGTGRDIELRPRGAREVRQATRAFLEMRHRIRRHLEQRTLISSALSHDLRTPITRMRVALEMGGDPEEIRRSLDEMDSMIGDFLEFARAGWREKKSAVDVRALIDEVASTARELGAEVEVVVDLPATHEHVRLRYRGMLRCLHNLVENAARYGQRIRLSATGTEGRIMFTVEDNGKGIPEEQRATALEPFRRLEEARTPDGRVGMGLGLAIVRDIARLHGGELRLGASAGLGGLAATVSVPVTADQ